MKQIPKIVSTLIVLSLIAALVAIPAPPAGADGLSPTPGWTYDGVQDGARLGNCVATGDFNADGYKDVIVGQYRYHSGTLSDAGRVLAFYGSAAGPSTTPGWTQAGDRNDMELGTKCANLGDVNGDGVDDLIVGAEGYANGQSYEGAAFIYYGSVGGGLPSTWSWMAEGNNDTAHFGYAVAGADVNGDGYRDVLVGADDYTNGESKEGRVFLYYGSASGPGAVANWTAEANLADSRFGHAVAGADVNADGYDDVIVGAPWYTHGEYKEGIAVLYYGSAAGLGPSGTPANADWLVESNQMQAELGKAVAAAGDVNGDGYDDVALGAYAYDGGHTNEGRASVYYGSASGPGAAASWTAEANRDYAELGFALAYGDVNDDGVDDLLVGAPGYNAGQAGEGAAFAYRGSSQGLGASGTPDNADWMAESNQVVAHLGWSIAAGDVDGDGFDDVLVGAPDYDTPDTNAGRAYLYTGKHVTLTVAKSGVDLNGGNLRVGDVVEYTITVANDSAVAIAGVSVRDAIPANTTFVPGSAIPPQTGGPNPLRWSNQAIPAERVVTYIFRVTVNGDTIGQTVSNTAEVQEPGQPLAVSPPVVLGPVAAHPYRIAKAAADLNGAPLVEGDVVEYTITISNDDNVYPLTGLAVTDAIPTWTTYVPGSAAPPPTTGPDPLVWSGQTVPAGGAATYTFRVQVDAGSAGQTVTNTARADGPSVDPADTGPVEPPGGGTVVPVGELQIAKVAVDLSGPPLYEGDVIEYTIAITNTGAIARTNVVVSDPIPDGTTYVPGSAMPPPAAGPDPLVWTIASLGAGASSVFTFRVTVDEGTVGQTIANQAAVDSDQDDEIITPPVTPPGDDPVQPPLPLQIAKTAEDLNGAPLVEGDVLEYTVTVTNPTTYPAGSVTLTDAIPAYTTYVPGSATPPQTSGPDPLVWSGQSIPAGSNATYTFQVTVNTGAVGQTITNVARVGGTNVVPGETAPVEPPGGGMVQPVDGLLIAKSAADLNGAPLYEGDVVEYTIAITNSAPVAHTNVSVRDLIPDGTTYVPGSATPPQTSGPSPLVWTTSSLDAGAGRTFTFQATVDDGTAGSSIGGNVARVLSSQQPTPSITPPTCPLDGCAVQPPAALQIAKFAADLNGAPLVEGDVIRYTVTVTNPTAYPAGGVVVTDAIPAYTTYVPGSATPPQTSGPDPLVWSGQSIPAGESAVYVFQVEVDAGALGQTITNVAQIGGANVAPTETLPVEPPGGGTVVPVGELQIAKMAADLSGAPLYEGDVVEYTIAITNAGAIARTNVVVSDAIPDGTTYVPGSADPPPASGPDPLVWTLFSLGAGASRTFTFRVTVDPGTAGQTIANQAQVDSDQDDEIITPPVTPPGDDPVQPPMALQVSKVAEDLNGAPLVEGDVLEYTITVTNPTAYLAGGVVVTDAIPAYTTYVPGSAVPPPTSGPDPLVWSGQSIPAGGIATYTFQVEVDAGALGQTIANVAQVGGTNVAPTETLPVEPPGGGTVVPVAGLQIAKSAADLNGAPLYEGDVVEYTIVITNPGAVAHTGVLVQDALPYGTTYVPGSATPPQTSGPDPLVWSAGTLAPGAVRTFSFRVMVDANMAGGQIGGNVASVTSDQQDTPIVNPPAWPPGGGAVDPLPDLQIRKTAEDLNGAPLYENDVIEYTIVVSNTSSGAATGVTISDTIPVSTTYVAGSATTTQGTISGPDPLVVDVGTLAAGSRVTVTFRVTVDAGAAGRTIENQAQVGHDQGDDVITPPVVPPGGPGIVAPYITIAKVGGDVNGPPLLAGDQVEYHVLVFNPAPVTATQIVITDYIPVHSTYVPGSATTTRGTLSGPDPLVVDVDEQPALTTTFVKFRVTVDPVTMLTTLTNTATAAVAGYDPVAAQAVLGPVGGDNVGLVIGKIAADVNGAPLYEGDVIEYTIGLANTDDTPHTNVVVTDAIPYGTTYVAGSATPAPSNAPNPLVWDVKSLPPKEIIFFTFRVTVDEGMAGQQIGGNVAVADSDRQGEPVETVPVYPGPVQGYVQPAALSIVKTALDVNGAPLHEGDVVRYTITVANQTTDTTHTNVIVEDSIPMSTTYVAGSAPPPPTSGPDPLVWTVASLPPGESRTFRFEVTVDEGTVGQRIGSNVATVHSDQAPPVITPPVLPPDPEVVEPDTGHYYYLPATFKNHATEPPPPPGGDDYEPDNSCSAATPIGFGSPQTHTFDPRADVDWVRFPMTVGRTYIIQTGDLLGGADTILQLYAGDCIVLLAENDDYGGNLWSRIEWQATVTGTFYARIRNYDPTAGDEGLGYTVSVQELP